MKTNTEVIKLNEYFDFEKTLEYIKNSKSAILENVSKNLYERVFMIDEQMILSSMSCEEYGADTTLKITAKGEEMDSYIFSKVVEKFHHIFSFNKGNIFEEISDKDLTFSTALNQFKNTKPVLIGEPYEALIWSIIGQQINVRFAEKLRYRFLELCDASILIGDVKYYYFPSPEQVLSVPKEEFQKMQFSKQKISYILSLTEAIVKGELILEELNYMDQTEATNYLTSFKGIGKWTADSILMRGIGFKDIFPAGDVGLQRIVSKVYKYQKNISEKELECLSQNWSPNRSWAAFLWWFSLQLE